MEYLTKEIIDDLVDNIFVLENGDLRVVFKYQDEFFEAKDFINKNNEAYQTLISRMDKINIENIISNADRRINTGE